MIKLVHRIGQGIFLSIESKLNGLFGPKMNPLYFLGGITYLMFWIIVISGCVIYAVYDTGVDSAFASVEKITNKQWYFAGVMRSMHRYASDGMILFAVLHLLRNFAFDRYRGFRWFSWYTGILLLWLIYIAGINGYWLPWDKLAHFAAVATTEWLDALPIFSAPLVRNFLEQGSVADRFFSLLSFMHIGVPLGAFIIVWVHTQRVPEAKTMPPKPVATVLVASMFVLALIKPAVSQGHADLDSVPLSVNLDRFFMWFYPLIYSWSPTKVWQMIGAITGVLLLLPFLGGKRRGKGEFQISTAPAGHTVMARNGETILEAGLRNGLHLPYVCRDGACGSCKGKILSGTVEYGTYQSGALTDEERKQGMALFCCAKPMSDLEVECKEVKELENIHVKFMNFVVRKMERAAQDVMLVELCPEADEKLNFLPGQYICIILEDGTKRSYSISNTPQESGCINLHIRLVPGGRFTTHVFTQMKVGDVLHVEGPLGTFFLHKDVDRPIILMSGGCGFGSIKGIVEDAFNSGLTRPMTLYWGARTPEGLYLADLPEKWQSEHENFKFIPVISDAQPEHNWQGRTGLVHQAIMNDYPQMNDFQVYACGSSEMIEAAQIPFFNYGLPKDQFFADKFTIASHQAPESKEGE